ncbi:MAG: 23S rRNA (adenine(2503)-C(2))-methyltransferase RlmN [Rhodobiaceae bacterium]|nr:23S rRNA (adenine(2503)-C(2))-methyltransferase RlmN [Rhodobiaceae bacterium]
MEQNINLNNDISLSEGIHNLNPLYGMSREDLLSNLSSLDIIPNKQIPMRIKQLWNWTYVNGVDDINSMQNISKPIRDKLQDIYTLHRPKIVTEQKSSDGTIKWLIALEDKLGNSSGNEIETVYIPDGKRGTLCLSSQIGCTLNCSFCFTGTQKLVRNLSTFEILSQILIARDRLDDWHKNNLNAQRKITNIVMMGMGEPLYNFEAVKNALLIASDGDGLAISKRRITLSTSGVVPMIERVATEIGVMLAISLHSVSDEVRNKLVPINKKYPIKELLKACKNFPGLKNSSRITFEYVMLKDINDSEYDAKKLVKMLEDIPSKINIIPFNPWPGSEYKCSDSKQIKKFADILNNAGFSSPIRRPRGSDIMAACGQLKSSSERIRSNKIINEF